MITLIDINGYEISIHIGVFIAISIYSLVKAVASAANRAGEIRAQAGPKLYKTDTDGTWKPPVG